MWCCRMRRRARILTILLACAAVMLWADAIAEAWTLMDAYGGVGVRMADARVPEKKLKRLLAGEAEDGIACTAAWTRGEKVAAEAPSMRTSEKLRVITVYGDMRQVAPMRLVSGSYPAEDDLTGCLLDTKSAWALFRSVDVTGAGVTVGKVRYTVRGVALGGEPMALVRGEDTAYENLELTVPDISTGKAAVDAFLYRYALSDDYAVVQGGLYARILWGLVWLPAVVVLAFSAFRLFCAALHRPRRAWALAGKLTAAIALAAAAAVLLRETFFWPQTFLPTKCADFAFWGSLLDGWREAWTELSLMTPLPKDIGFFRDMRACLCRIAAILALEAFVCGRMRGSRNINETTRETKA